jgi:hypothetical protein
MDNIVNWLVFAVSRFAAMSQSLGEWCNITQGRPNCPKNQIVIFKLNSLKANFLLAITKMMTHKGGV